ncbi:MAG: hypothetical protein ACI38Y_05090 [Candidatus Methanomethylophilaceae archaeon]
MGKRGPKLRYNDIPCPNGDCHLYGRIGEGNITSRGTWTNSSGEVVRKFVCTACGRTFNSRTGTVYEGSHLPTEQFDSIVYGLNNGSTIREMADSEGVNRNTVLLCKMRAGMSKVEGAGSIDIPREG